jgi:hypothetical protein
VRVAARCALFACLLAVAHAISPEWAGLQNHVAIIGSQRVEPVAEVYRVEYVRAENICVVGMAPEDDKTLFSGSPHYLLPRDCHSWHGVRTIWSNDLVRCFDLSPRLGKILTVRNAAFKETDRGPCSKFSSSGAPEILEICCNTIERRLALFVIKDDLRAAGRGNDSPQLLASINLGIVGHAPLLPNEKIAGDIGENQKPSEPRNRPRPPHHVALDLALGIVGIIAGCLLIARTIRHALLSLSPPTVTSSILQLLVAGVLLVSGLAILFP